MRRYVGDSRVDLGNNDLGGGLEVRLAVGCESGQRLVCMVERCETRAMHSSSL